MTESTPRSDASASPAAMLQMMTGYWVSQAIYVAAKLGIADMLAEGPVDVDLLAEASESHAPSLRRVLRALATVDVFTEPTPGSFALRPLGELLRTDLPGSMRSLGIMYAEEQYQAWGEALHSVKTGETAFPRQFGMDYFPYLADHPESNRVFNEAMTGFTAQLVGGVLEAYDFSSLGTVMDVGGSYGTMLAAILRRNPGIRGILFDQPHVVADADAHLAAEGLADRCTTVGGDFFTEVPSGADAYVLAQILHDWDDERCTVILEQCRRAMAADGKLLVIELVLPENENPFFGKWLDLHMMVLLGARERTESEYAALLASAGFELTRVIPTTSGTSIVEAIPVAATA